MSYLPMLLDFLKIEVNYLIDNPQAFTRLILSRTVTNISMLFRAPNQLLRIKVLNLISPNLAARILKNFDIHTRVEYLYQIKESQRHLIASNFSEEKRETMLKGLEYWQLLEMLDWSGAGNTLPILVLTGEIPAHYPRTMRICAVCARGYIVWDSIIAADCGKHSFCEGCEPEEGICPKC
jgi:hypothetical protein